VVRRAGEPGWTAAALWERSRAIAGGLARLVGVEDAVATCLPAGPEAIAVTTALSALGAVELPLSSDVDGRWARTLAHSAGCVTTVTTGDLLRDAPFLGELAHSAGCATASDLPHDAPFPGAPGRSAGCATTRGLPRDSPGPDTTTPVVVVGGTGVVCLDELVAAGRPVGMRRVGPGDPALVMTTSGTTGRVKGALLPVAAGPGQTARVQRAMRYSPADVLYNFFPGTTSTPGTPRSCPPSSPAPGW